jgi:hypothetical protein
MQLAAYLPSEPPADLLLYVFPWVEQEQEALRSRARDNPLANDMALKQFLQLLIWLRKVLLQDAAVLFMQDPSCPIFRYSIFQSAAFRDFAVASQQALINAEKKARAAFERLPDHLIKSLQGILTNSRVEQQQDRENYQRQLSAMDARLDAVLQTVVSTKSSRQRGRTGETFFKFVLFFGFLLILCSPATHLTSSVICPSTSAAATSPTTASTSPCSSSHHHHQPFRHLFVTCDCHSSCHILLIITTTCSTSFKAIC